MLPGRRRAGKASARPERWGSTPAVGTRRPRGSVALPSLVAGGLAALSLPPWGWWPLGIVGAGLLWWRLDGLRRRARLLGGWLFGVGLFVPGLWWATHFNVYGGFVLMLLEALAPAAAALLTPGRAGRLLALPGAMVLAEALRDHWPFGGLPIGSMALGQAAGPLAVTARLGGPLLVLGCTWLAGAACGALAVAAVDASSSSDRAAPLGLAGGCALVVVAAVTTGAVLAPAGAPVTGTLPVAAVQGGGRRGVDQSQVPPFVVLNAALAATTEVPGYHGGAAPKLVLWPEDVVSLPGPLAGTRADRLLAADARRLHAVLVAGVTEDVGATRFRNEAVAFSPTGRVIASYEKVHRVPFGEYVPDRSLFAHLANLSAVPRDAIPGHGDGVLRTPVATLGTMISFEVFFPHRSRLPTLHGAELLIVPTNTSSYRTSQIPSQEVASDRLQAISEGRYLVQAAPTGFTDVVTPEGAVVHRSVLGKRQVITAAVQLRHGLTPYALGGSTPVLGAAGAGVLAGWLVAWRRRRRIPRSAATRWG